MSHAPDTESNRQAILDQLEPLFKTAVANNKWFITCYQAIVFSPKELREEHKKGKFIWGAVNWQLIDPPKPKDVDEVIRQTRESNQKLLDRIRDGWNI